MNFPRSSERYDLLGTVAYRELVAERLAKAENSVLIVSAYVTFAGLHWIRNCGLPRGLPVTIVTQWKPRDLLSGASDLEAYKFSLDQQWRFNLLPHLHAKLVLIDDAYLFVGSANVTAFGLNLVPGGNRELGICVAASKGDVHSVRGLVDESVEVSPEMFSQVESWIGECPAIPNPPLNLGWPVSIEQLMLKPPNRLWVSDLPWAVPDRVMNSGLIHDPAELEAINHDVRLLGAQDETNLKIEFRCSRAYSWLVHKLSKEPNQAAYFGRLAELLHKSLLDDPAPFRKDVKMLLSNLLAYAAQFAGPEISFERPNYSTKISLKASL